MRGRVRVLRLGQNQREELWQNGLTVLGVRCSRGLPPGQVATAALSRPALGSCCEEEIHPEGRAGGREMR